jgi:hypothetical protein
MKFRLIILCSWLLTVPCSWCNVAVLLEEPFGTFGAMNPTGHAAIYLSRLCAETPTRLRRCLPGEAGAVISRYHHIAGYDWIAIPLIPYLYAVDQPSQVPAAADSDIVTLLRDGYRRQHLADIIPDGKAGQTPKGEWIQLVGAAYDRRIFAFEVETDEAQDDRLISRLNKRSNRSHFNLLFHNCADFARSVVNTYYPRAVHRSFLADAGITTPKQVGKSMVEFSDRHPELRFSVFVIPQVPGTNSRSTAVHGVYESLLKSKKYVVPLAILHPFLASGMFAAYVVGGRFDPAAHADNEKEPFRYDRPEQAAPSLSSFLPAGERAGGGHTGGEP